MAKRVADADPEMEIGGDQFVEEFCTKPTFDEDGVQATSGIGKDGKEYPDPTPMAVPVGFGAPPDLMEMMRTMIRNEVIQRRLDEEGFDTFDEAGDFDVDDDPLPPLTIHEALFVPPPPSTEAETGKGPQSPASPSPSPPAPQAAEGGVASPPPGTPNASASTST